jgi:hypothetical protein
VELVPKSIAQSSSGLEACLETCLNPFNTVLGISAEGSGLHFLCAHLMPQNTTCSQNRTPEHQKASGLGAVQWRICVQVQCAEDEGDQITWELVVPAVEIAEGFEHRESADKGRGLFATRVFDGGDVVLTNRPLAITEDEKAQLFDLSNNVITNSSQVLRMQTSTIRIIAHLYASAAQPHWCKLSWVTALTYVSVAGLRLFQES